MLPDRKILQNGNEVSHLDLWVNQTLDYLKFTVFVLETRQIISFGMPADPLLN